MSGNAHDRRKSKRAGHVDHAPSVDDIVRLFTDPVLPEAMPNLRAKFRAFFSRVLRWLGRPASRNPSRYLL